MLLRHLSSERHPERDSLDSDSPVPGWRALPDPDSPEQQDSPGHRLAWSQSRRLPGPLQDWPLASLPESLRDWRLGLHRGLQPLSLEFPLRGLPVESHWLQRVQASLLCTA